MRRGNLRNKIYDRGPQKTSSSPNFAATMAQNRIIRPKPSIPKIHVTWFALHKGSCPKRDLNLRFKAKQRKSEILNYLGFKIINFVASQELG